MLNFLLCLLHPKISKEFWYTGVPLLAQAYASSATNFESNKVRPSNGESIIGRREAMPSESPTAHAWDAAI